MSEKLDSTAFQANKVNNFKNWGTVLRTFEKNTKLWCNKKITQDGENRK